jgi:hypothetical protein
MSLDRAPADGQPTCGASDIVLFEVQRAAERCTSDRLADGPETGPLRKSPAHDVVEAIVLPVVARARQGLPLVSRDVPELEAPASNVLRKYSANKLLQLADVSWITPLREKLT